MRTNLQAIRKARGYKSAREFALAHGFNVGTYTNHEQGKRDLSLAIAVEYADALECSIDELAGRDFRPDTPYADQSQAALNGYYESMNSQGRGALVESARLMSGSPETRIEKNSPEHTDVPKAV